MNKQTKTLVAAFTEQMQEKNIRFSFKYDRDQSVFPYFSSLQLPNNKAVAIFAQSKNKKLRLSPKFIPQPALFSAEEKTYLFELFSFWLHYNQIHEHDVLFLSIQQSDSFFSGDEYKQWLQTHHFHFVSKGKLSFFAKYKFFEGPTEGYIKLCSDSPAAIAFSYLEKVEKTLQSFSDSTPSFHLKKAMNIKKPIPFYYEGQSGEFIFELINDEYVISESHLKRIQKIKNVEDISTFIHDTLQLISQKHRIRNLYKKHTFFFDKWTSILQKKYSIFHLPIKEIHQCFLTQWSPKQLEDICAREIKKETFLACSKNGYTLFTFGTQVFVTHKDVLFETTLDKVEEAFDYYQSCIIKDMQGELTLQKQAILSIEKAAY